MHGPLQTSKIDRSVVWIGVLNCFYRTNNEGFRLFVLNKEIYLSGNLSNSLGNVTFSNG